MNPISFIPDRKVGPAVIPITAINIFNPRLLKIHTAGSGMRPKVGCLVLSHPKNKPDIKAPPLVLRLIGIPPKRIVNAPTIPPINIPKPTKIRSVLLVGRSTYPNLGEACFISLAIPTISSRSPACNFVFAKIGNSTPALFTFLIIMPCMNGCRRNSLIVFPFAVF